MDKQQFPGKVVASDEVLRCLFSLLLIAPDSQVSVAVKGEVSKFLTKSRTSAEMFDFLCELSRKPPTEVSQFVKTACALDEYYAKPDLK